MSTWLWKTWACRSTTPSVLLMKVIQQDTTNAKHKQLAQTIFTTPNMILRRAASLFESYNAPSGPAAEPPPQTVNVVSCRYSKGKDHKNYLTVQRKSPIPIIRGLKIPTRLFLHVPDQPSSSVFHALSATSWLTCPTCVLVARKPEGVSLSHPAGRINPPTAPTGSRQSDRARHARQEA